MIENPYKEIINPEVQYTELQHEIAKRKYMFDLLLDEIYDIVFEIKTNKLTDLKEIEQKIVKILFPSDEISMHDYIENKIDWQAVKEHVTQNHCGDCTAIPATCFRCYVEQFYGVNTTPKNKQVGSAALYGYTFYNNLNSIYNLKGNPKVYDRYRKYVTSQMFKNRENLKTIENTIKEKYVCNNERDFVKGLVYISSWYLLDIRKDIVLKMKAWIDNNGNLDECFTLKSYLNHFKVFQQ